MSAAAKRLTTEPAVVPTIRTRNGPVPSCRGLYDADLEDAEAIYEYRTRKGQSWRTAHIRWDEILNIAPDQRVPTDLFRYHWKRGCGCWPDDLRV